MGGDSFLSPFDFFSGKFFCLCFVCVVDPPHPTPPPRSPPSPLSQPVDVLIVVSGVHTLGLLALGREDSVSIVAEWFPCVRTETKLRLGKCWSERLSRLQLRVEFCRFIDRMQGTCGLPPAPSEVVLGRFQKRAGSEFLDSVMITRLIPYPTTPSLPRPNGVRFESGTFRVFVTCLHNLWTITYKHVEIFRKKKRERERERKKKKKKKREGKSAMFVYNTEGRDICHLFATLY